MQIIDISEDKLNERGLLEPLLKDHTTGGNIMWCTRDYEDLGYAEYSEIVIQDITKKNRRVIQPRVLKARSQQKARSKEKAEIFTPSWVCNCQNNLVDEAWFGRKGVFNTENPDHTWTTNPARITFPKGKTWKEYIQDNVLEITCGEAPYLVSFYDTTTGDTIPIQDRIGIIDRKLRVVNENTDNEADWIEAAKVAYMSTYGYEWQGDSLLLARENMLETVADYYRARFAKEPDVELLKVFAYIISWNLLQMDGLKFVLPGSIERGEFTEFEVNDGGLFATTEKRAGTFCKIRDWIKEGEHSEVSWTYGDLTEKAGHTLYFVDLYKNK